MKALTVTDVAKFTLEDIPVPNVGLDEVLIKVAYCGICGSDLPRYFDGGVHSFPQVLGHEFSGVVSEVGKEVTKFKAGDRVAVAPLIPLTDPETWVGGNPAMADKYSFIGSRQQGAMAEYVSVPEKNCITVPQTLSLKKAAVVEPLTVAIHGVDRASLHAGVKTLVFGAGTIGLLTIAVLRARGVGEIIVVDLNDKKLEFAKTMGADITINPSKKSLDTFFGDQDLPEVVFETAGSNITQKQSIQYVGKRGQVVYIGTMTKNVDFEPELLEQILRREAIVTGAWMSYSMPFPGYEWETALRYMEKGDIDVAPLITGIFKLEDKEEPFKKMIEKDSAQVKLMYKVNDLGE